MTSSSISRSSIPSIDVCSDKLRDRKGRDPGVQGGHDLALDRIEVGLIALGGCGEELLERRDALLVARGVRLDAPVVSVTARSSTNRRSARLEKTGVRTAWSRFAPRGL